ncbi:endolytic transglycosylase MltG [Polynucleobacter antarcticus]
MSFYHSVMSKKFQRRSLFRKKPSFRSRYSYLLRLLLAVVALLLTLYAAIFLLPVIPNVTNIPADSKALPKESASYKVKILPQSGLSTISRQLVDQGIETYPIVFQIAARAIFVGTSLKPGTYLLPLNASLGNVILQIARGDRIRESIAIIPGMTIWQLRAVIDAHPALIHQTKGMSNKQLLQSLNLNYPSDEGIFFPDTYIFDPDDSDLFIYRRAAQAMQKQLNAAWELRDIKTPLKTPYELLILASIIEKETGRSSDRPLVASVFINRLNINMPLQTDPTVIYGIGPRFDGNLRKTDLRKDTPYNTYMRKGLPPTPIAMPSKESLRAAVQPAQSNALYFVSRGDGTSQFSKSLSEHENAVDRYQRKQVALSRKTTQ